MGSQKLKIRSSLVWSGGTAILFGILVLVLLLMWGLNPTRFLKISNIQSMAFQLPELGLLSFAMMVAMISGGTNLSIISTANLSGIVAALIMQAAQKSGTLAPGIITAYAILAAIAASAIIGLLNGFLIAYIEVPPMLATLGTMIFLNGISVSLTRGYVISGFPEDFLFIGNGLVLGIPMPIILFAAAAALIALLFDYTPYGFELYMLGTNPVATRYAGVNNRKILMKTYLLSGVLCGLAAIIMISRFNSAKSDYGASYLLVTMLAAVLCGVSVYGGSGKVSGIVLSLIILQLLSSGLNLLRANAFFTRVVWGVVLILVMIINRISSYIKDRG